MAPKFLVAPTKERPASEINRYSELQQLNNALLTNFHFTTLLLIGALIQGIIVLIFPRIWALLPTVLVILVRSGEALAITFKFKPNPYLENVIYEKWATTIPDTDGNFSAEPADGKVAVLLLCLKVNHPLGLFAPNVKRVDDFANDMAKELDAGAKDNGFLAQTAYSNRDAKGAPEIMLVSYWRSIEDIHNYSNGPLHKQAMKWWEDMNKNDKEGMKHVGISHEIFEAPRSRWEAVYINTQPTRMGATSFFKKGDKHMGGIAEDQWISPVVAGTGKWRTSRGRLNWAETGTRRSSPIPDGEKQ